MVNDLERQLYIDMADFKEQVAELKMLLTKLSNRIESLELMAFQDQILKLDDEVNSLNKSLIAIGRTVALNEMDSLQLHIILAIRQKLSATDPKRKRLEEYIAVKYTTAKEKLRDSPTPLAILFDFKNLCTNCSEKNNLRAFTGEP